MDTKTAEGLLAGLPVPVLLVSAGEKVQAANAAARGLFGTDVVGRPCATFLRHPAFLNALEISLRGAAAGEARLTLPGKAAGELQVRAHLAPVADMDGRGGVLVTFEDLTELERAEAMRRDFVANVSHELRTPLTALVGFIETLKGAAKEDPVARDRFLAIMEGEAGRMIRLVNDLLSLSRVEAEERGRWRRH
jgi:two-component system, OmpR family, phosphate regulon sensor histidine kinase PhoR